eukprot:Clim_evm11s198 gene=Clim_evmTU11s198
MRILAGCRRLLADSRGLRPHSLLQRRAKQSTSATDFETIFALATPPGRSGVAVIRISGPGARNALTSLVQPPVGNSYEAGLDRQLVPPPRFLAHRTLYGQITFDRLGPDVSEGDKGKERIDQALVCHFEGPHSLTGEDVVELQTHGSMAIVRSLLHTLQTIPGLRRAEPGEFLKRAFFHGKVDLTQAEGLAEVLEAETSEQLRLANRAAEGLYAAKFSGLRQRLIDVAAIADAYLEFADEGQVDEGTVANDFVREVQSLHMEVDRMLSTVAKGQLISEGISVALIGPPNVGKSTLLNLLTASNRSIVSEYAGTTRDVVDAATNLEGFKVRIFDTAGLRDQITKANTTDKTELAATNSAVVEDTIHPIEIEGMQRSLEALDMSDIVILVLDGDRSSTEQLPTSVVNKLKIKDQDRIIRIVNKIDLIDSGFADGTSSQDKFLPVSCKTGDGIDALRSELRSTLERVTQTQLSNDYEKEEEIILVHDRQRQLLHEVHNDLCLVLREMEDRELADWVMVTESLRASTVSLGRITGRIDAEDILDSIFGRFCIGK